MLKLGVVIPVGPDRRENLVEVLRALQPVAHLLSAVVVVEDGLADLAGIDRGALKLIRVPTPKHEPGAEQPRNIGVGVLAERAPETTHVWFLDSDVVPEPSALAELVAAIKAGPPDRIIVAPYDWMPEGVRPDRLDFYERAASLTNDPRWAMIRANPPSTVFHGDLSAGLACFSGNLVWYIPEFMRVGGFWSELHHGRCEDGELGLRAVAMGVGISFAAGARGYHLAHPVNTPLALERNRRDVPMLNARHPWVQGAGVLVVDRDGKAFDVRCPKCEEVVPTLHWWAHAEACGVSGLPVD